MIRIKDFLVPRSKGRVCGIHIPISALHCNQDIQFLMRVYKSRPHFMSIKSRKDTQSSLPSVFFGFQGHPHQLSVGSSDIDFRCILGGSWSVWYFSWFRNPKQPPGMYKNPVTNGITYHINWWIPDFWTINSTTRVVKEKTMVLILHASQAKHDRTGTQSPKPNHQRTVGFPPRTLTINQVSICTSSSI